MWKCRSYSKSYFGGPIIRCRFVQNMYNRNIMLKNLQHVSYVSFVTWQLMNSPQDQGSVRKLINIWPDSELCSDECVHFNLQTKRCRWWTIRTHFGQVPLNCPIVGDTYSVGHVSCRFDFAATQMSWHWFFFFMCRLVNRNTTWFSGTSSTLCCQWKIEHRRDSCKIIQIVCACDRTKNSERSAGIIDTRYLYNGRTWIQKLIACANACAMW